MLVVYTSYSEVLICHSSVERRMLSLWFSTGGRTLGRYTRDEYPAEMIAIRQQSIVSGIGETPRLAEDST